MRLAVRAYIGLGRVKLAVGEAVRAEEEFRRAVTLDPTDPDPLYWLGCAAAHQGAHTFAERKFTEALGRCEGHGRILVQRAYARVRLGRPAQALADLRAAERVGALDAEARWVMAALSGTPARDVARLLAAAARSAMTRAQAAGPQGRSGPGDDWSRAATLLDSARRLAPDVREFTLPHAVALCLSGRRPDALALLADASRAAPADRSVAHALAVMTWHGLPPSSGPGTAQAWARCVALWTGLLHDTAFWERWRTGTAQRYGAPVDDADLATLRADLHTRLEAAMPEHGPSGRPSPDAVLHRETEAARRLADAGGLPLAAGAAPVVCGPLRIADLGREKELGAFVAALGEAAPALRRAFSQLGFVESLLSLDRPDEALAALSGLRCPSCRARGSGPADGPRRPETGRTSGPTEQATQSGQPLFQAAQVLSPADQADQADQATQPNQAKPTGRVDGTGHPGHAARAPQPAEAAQAPQAPEAAPTTTQAPPSSPAPAQQSASAIPAHTSAVPAPAPAPHGPGRAAAPVCDPHCPHFDARNPAYAGQPGRHALLLRDGRVLALEARLAQGRAALGTTGPDVPAAARSWQRALGHARALEREAEVEEAIAGTALGAAKALYRAGDLKAAGAALEAACALVGEGRRNRLQGQLARVLTDRGIMEANRDPEQLESPAADLRRAVELNPHLHRPQVNLGLLLRFLGARLRWSGSLVGARNRLEEARDRLTDALAHFPDDPELTELRDLVEHDLTLVHSELTQGRIGGLPE
ncbi:tetratricopeptide repeat protein [Streptomyces bullii]